jgi:glycosyltransferase involved in cell wall biosynthesis
MSTNATEDGPHDPHPPEISVIVPCLDSTYLAQTLESLRRQRGAPAFEVVVVDAGNRNLERRLRGWLDRLDLRVVPGDRVGTAAAQRNRAVAECRGTLLIFVDADDTADDRYVGELARALGEHPLVCARVEMTALNPWNPGGTHPQQTGLITSDLGFLPFAGAGTLGIRRETFERFHGFDPSLPCYEEADLCWRIQLSGDDPPSLVDGALLHVRMPAAPRARLRKAMRFGATQALLYRRYRASGMRRPPLLGALQAWIRLPLIAAGRLLGRHGAHPAWEIGLRFGRLEGSIRHGILYL